MRCSWIMAAGVITCLASITDALAQGSAVQGEKVFRLCVACHSVEPGRHRTGPSLANIWGQAAGTVEGFGRYSTALKESGLSWDENSLDAWLNDPRATVPGNRMTFRGIAEEGQRRDLIAYLRQVSEAGGGASAAGEAERGGGMMGGGAPLDLRALGPNNLITSMSHCGDTYTVATKTGEVHQFWEFNLRFKTDGSAQGPAPGHPVIVPAGMMGDRAFVVFTGPGEISGFIGQGC